MGVQTGMFILRNEFLSPACSLSSWPRVLPLVNAVVFHFGIPGAKSWWLLRAVPCKTDMNLLLSSNEGCYAPQQFDIRSQNIILIIIWICSVTFRNLSVKGLPPCVLSRLQWLQSNAGMNSFSCGTREDVAKLMWAWPVPTSALGFS